MRVLYLVLCFLSCSMVLVRIHADWKRSDVDVGRLTVSLTADSLTATTAVQVHPNPVKE